MNFPLRSYQNSEENSIPWRKVCKRRVCHRIFVTLFNARLMLFESL